MIASQSKMKTRIACIRGVMEEEEARSGGLALENMEGFVAIVGAHVSIFLSFHFQDLRFPPLTRGTEQVPKRERMLSLLSWHSLLAQP